MRCPTGSNSRHESSCVLQRQIQLQSRGRVFTGPGNCFKNWLSTMEWGLGEPWQAAATCANKSLLPMKLQHLSE